MEKLEFFEKMYALNDDYHNKKEQMIWLATTIYLGFVIVSAKWLFDTVQFWKCYWPYTVGFAFAVFVFATLFICMQNGLKCRSAEQTDRMQGFIHRFDHPKDMSFSELSDACRSAKKFRLCWFWKYGRPGLLCNGIAIIFGAAQFGVVCLLQR